jgi:hypothetical protein
MLPSAPSPLRARAARAAVAEYRASLGEDFEASAIAFLQVINRIALRARSGMDRIKPTENPGEPAPAAEPIAAT